MTTKELVAPNDNGANALMAIISRAANDPAFDVSKLDHLLAVKERWEKDEARKAFVSALTEFKKDPPDIFKNKTVAFKDTKYRHASLDNVSIAIGTALSKYGLSHRWSVEQADTRIKVTCILMHNAGHSESLSMQSASDQSGSKNAIQALGSAVTYLERYTLLAITGMAVQDDDDGAASQPPAAPIPGPTEAKAASTTPPPAPTDPITIKPGIVKKKGDQFIIPDIDSNDNYFTNDESVALFAKAHNKSGESIRLLFDYKDGKRWISSVDK